MSAVVRFAFKSILVPWALDHIDEAIDLVLPVVVRELGMEEQAADIASAVVPSVIEAGQTILRERPDLGTEEGAALIVAELRDTLDVLADDWPVLRTWTEADRDAYIHAIATTTLYTLRVIREARSKDVRIRRRVLRKTIQRELMPKVMQGLKRDAA